MCLIGLSSCVNSMDEPYDYPVVGKWAALNEDGSVSKYVEFNIGKYYEYTTESQLYYSDKKIWNAKEDDFSLVMESWYSITGGKLKYDGNSEKISFSEGMMKLGDMEFYPVEKLDENYGFILTHDIVTVDGVFVCPLDSQELVWNYQIEGLPAGNLLQVEVESDWIHVVEITDSQIKLSLDVNDDLAERSATLALSHPAIATETLTLSQSFYGLQLSSYTTETTYKGGNYEVSFTIENPEQGMEPSVKCDADWISDLAIQDNKITFTVSQNNGDSDRSADVVLEYGSECLTHKVEQSYLATVIKTNPASTTCNYKAKSLSFTYTITNPREGVDLVVSCAADWITILPHDKSKVFFTVSENSTEESREAEIQLTYGKLVVVHKVEQGANLPPELIATPEKMSCDHNAATKSFTYTIKNPIEGKELVWAKDFQSWFAEYITDVDITTDEIIFEISKNDTGVKREGLISFIYGDYIFEYHIVQSSEVADLSKSETANCYIVPRKGGSYKFLATKGNSSNQIEDIASVSVLWQLNSGWGFDSELITDLRYSDGYICFSTSYDSGNAVVAALDSDKNVLWSWHLWIISEFDPLQEQEYKNGAGIMMDRNLGAIYSSPEDIMSHGLLYQWGRKDPFLGAKDLDSNERMDVQLGKYGFWNRFVTDGARFDIDASIGQPMTYFHVKADNWYDLGDSAIDLWSQDNKTIYDPCPPGWRVPEGGADGVWAKAMGKDTYDLSDNAGGDCCFYLNGVLGEDEIIYPLTSYYSNVKVLTSDCNPATCLCKPGRVGRYWSCGLDDWGWPTPAVFEISADGKVSCNSVYSAAMGYPVRCMKDN